MRWQAFGVAAVMTAAALAACSRAPQPVAGAVGPRVLGPLTASAFAGGKQPVVMVPTRNRQQLAKLAELGMEIWTVDAAAGKAFGQITPDLIPAIEAMGLQAKIVQGPGQGRNTFDKGYRTYEQIRSLLEQTAAQHPEIAKLVDLGDSWEKTQGKANRDVLALRLGKGKPEGKPGIIFCGNHHAREIVTPEVVLRIIEMLVGGYGQDPEMTAAIDNLDIYLVPMVNPDGHAQAARGADWRKNTNLTTGGGTQIGNGPNGPGVDLNRNYGFKWGGPGAATSPTSATFRGPSAFSEPETQAMKGLIDSRKFSFLMTYHSFSNLILWPWGHTDAPPPDARLATIGKKLGELSGYKPEQSVELYPTSGDTTDYAFGQHGILSYTTEIGTWGDGFDPPYAKMAQFWKENERGARLLLKLTPNPSWVNGPELRSAKVVGGQLEVEAPGATAVEAFVGLPGQDGQGVALKVAPGRATGAVPAQARQGQLLYVHAKDAAGHWGPPTALFAR